jgi:hypothetical protein
MFTVPEAIGHIINIKLYVLDPMSVIVKLAILANKPIGTKIIIKHNAINVDENTFMQSMYRFLNGHTKSDLHYLYNPIQIACTQYLSYKTKSVFESAIVGLKHLIETYNKHSIVTVCLKYYISIITSYIETLNENENGNGNGNSSGGSNCENNCNKLKKIKQIHTTPPGHGHDNMTSLYTTDLLDNLKTVWSKDKLKIVVELIAFLDNDAQTASEQNVKAIESIMTSIDAETQHIILTI